MPPAPERRPATEAVQMIEPLPAARMIGLACLMAMNGPIRLIRSRLCQKASSTSSSGVMPPLTPALANTASRRPNSRAARSMAALISASEPALPVTAIARPPALTIMAADALGRLGDHGHRERGGLVGPDILGHLGAARRLGLVLDRHRLGHPCPGHRRDAVAAHILRRPFHGDDP